jgi:site-specific DNA recombinase
MIRLPEREAGLTKAIGYIRVSPEEQAQHGVSLNAQRARIAAYALLYGLELVEVIEDAGISGKSLDRPGLKRALDLLKAGKAEALVVAKLDRLTRSVVDLGKLIESTFAAGKAALLSVSEQIDTRSAAGRFMLNVLGSVAQWERETIGERTSSALQHMKARGLRVGAVPYGHALAADGRTLAPLPAEQVVIGLAKELRAAGLSLRAIAARLAEAGHLSRAGRRFEPTQIKAMVV